MSPSRKTGIYYTMPLEHLRAMMAQNEEHRRALLTEHEKMHTALEQRKEDESWCPTLLTGEKDVWYFGSLVDVPGHRLFSPTSSCESVFRTQEWEWVHGRNTNLIGDLDIILDGGLLMEYPEHGGEGRQNQAVLTHIDAATVISFWDRTGDERSNSHSNFIATGKYTFDQMVGIAKRFFPHIWARITAKTPVTLK